jgi:sarcosine oxidase subunit beta
MTQEIKIPPPPCGDPKSILIIGGGAVGASCAFELQRAGHHVTLLEARSIGNGSSSRSAACIRAQWGNPSTVRGMVYCERYYKNWTSVVGGSRSPMTSSGYLFMHDWAADMNAVRKVVAMQQNSGLTEVEVLDANALFNLFPYIETTGIQAATWCSVDGFLDPVAVYGDAIEAACKLGAVVKQSAEVVSVVFDQGQPVAVRTADGREFTADLFVNACGSWAPDISRFFNGHPLEIDSRKRYLYFLDGLNGHDGEFMSRYDFAHLPMIITPRGCYCRPESAHGGKLMMGWLHHAEPIRNPTFEVQDDIEPGFSPREEGNYGLAVRKEVTTYLPDAGMMGNLAVVSAGLYEDTPDRLPLIGWDPSIPRLIHAAGFSGHGLMHAPFTAATVAHLIAAGHNIDTIELPLVGNVNINTFAVDRQFTAGEDMVI